MVYPDLNLSIQCQVPSIRPTWRRFTVRTDCYTQWLKRLHSHWKPRGRSLELYISYIIISWSGALWCHICVSEETRLLFVSWLGFATFARIFAKPLVESVTKQYQRPSWKKIPHKAHPMKPSYLYAIYVTAKMESFLFIAHRSCYAWIGHPIFRCSKINPQCGIWVKGESIVTGRDFGGCRRANSPTTMTTTTTKTNHHDKLKKHRKL